MKHYLYRMSSPVEEPTIDSPVGLVSIPDESYMHRVPDNAVEIGTNPVPEDENGTYFEAWRLGDDGVPFVDFEAAKEIKLTSLRMRRDNLFKGLDADQFRAFCAKNDKLIEAIEIEKDKLRGFPDRINWDSVKSVKELNFILPPELV